MSSEEIAEIIHILIYMQAFHIEGRTIATWGRMSSYDQKMYTDAVVWIQANEVTPAKVHDFWADRMKAMGWIYGPVKSIDKLEHPGLVPYDQLSDYEKAKDVLFMTLAKIL